VSRALRRDLERGMLHLGVKTSTKWETGSDFREVRAQMTSGELVEGMLRQLALSRGINYPAT